VIAIVGLILLALIGAPLFCLFSAAALTEFLQMPEGSFASVGIDVFSAKFAENPTLVTLPLFTFAGYLLAESGMPGRLIEASRAWLGWMPGGLAVVCLMASAFFTTFTGGSGITIVAVGGLLLPAMLQEKYPANFSYGLVTTGGSLGILFPPSVPLLLYGIIASVNMEKLLLAGIVPGILVVVVLGIYAAFVGVRSNFESIPFHWGRAWRALWVMKWEAAIPIVLLGGIFTGILRIHEASAFTAMYVLIIEVFVYRDISIRKDLPRVVVESMTLIGAILIILACGIGFTAWMIQDEIPTKLLDWLQGQIHGNRFVFLVMLNVFLIVVGMLMEIFTAIVVAVPLVLPLAKEFGLDPFHFAIIFLLNLEIAYLAPPLGINLFISSIRFGKPVTYLYRVVLPFIGVLFVTLMIVCYVPIIVTWLPSLLKTDEDMSEASLTAPSTAAAEDLNDLAVDEPDGGVDGGIKDGDAGIDAGVKKAEDEAAGAGAATGKAAKLGAAATAPPKVKVKLKPPAAATAH
jgi:tripartite ATP-independent transporter DctM subunit